MRASIQIIGILLAVTNVMGCGGANSSEVAFRDLPNAAYIAYSGAFGATGQRYIISESSEVVPGGCERVLALLEGGDTHEFPDLSLSLQVLNSSETTTIHRFPRNGIDERRKLLAEVAGSAHEVLIDESITFATSPHAITGNLCFGTRRGAIRALEANTNSGGVATSGSVESDMQLDVNCQAGRATYSCTFGEHYFAANDDF